MKFLGIIPARGGSKGVVRKNIRLLAGKPLIAYTIEAALSSQKISELIVSTEDPEIAEVAKSFGAKVLIRPAELAEDATPMVDVVKHIFSSLEGSSAKFDAGILLQPTTPLRTAAHIDEALSIFEKNKVESLVSVYEVGDCHPARMYRLENEVLIPLQAEAPAKLRQNLPKVYHRNGAIYIFTKGLLERGLLMSEKPTPYIMPRDKSVNIDEEMDLDFANFLLLSKQKDRL